MGFFRQTAASCTEGCGTIAGDITDALQANDEELTFDQLTRVENRRRSILRRSEEPFYSVLCHWDGTCLRILILDPLIWLTVTLYVLIRVKCHIGLPDYMQDADLSSSNISVIGGFLSFFLVFFVVSSNKNFHEQYNLCMKAKGKIFEVASIAQAFLPREIGLRLVRRMNAAQVAGYIGLSNTYTETNLFAEINKSFKLLSDEEMKRVVGLNMNAGGSAFREIIAWCQHDVAAALKEEAIDNRLASQLRDKLLDLQSAFGGLYNHADQPISFFYVHFICLLSALYLPLFAVSTAFGVGVGDVFWTADVINGLVVALQAIFVVGLRQLGQNMADPFGDDLEDLSVLTYCKFTWTMRNRIMAARVPSPPTSSSAFEEDLVREREASIGNAWEDKEEKETSNKQSKSSSTRVGGAGVGASAGAGVEGGGSTYEDGYHILT